MGVAEASASKILRLVSCRLLPSVARDGSDSAPVPRPDTWEHCSVTRSLVEPLRRVAGLLLALGLACGGLTGCEQDDNPTLIAFLLASDSSDRWLNADEPAFRQQVKSTCKGCKYVTYDARRDPAEQAEQFTKALADGADVVVLNPVDSEKAEELVVRAGSVPVVAYDRFVAGADYYVSYDATSTGKLQAEATVRALDGKGSILIVNGAQTDANGVAIKQARKAVFKRTKIEVLAELDPSNWDGDVAGSWVTEQLKKNPISGIDAIVAANDEQAAGIVAALKAKGIGRDRLPFLTGQDAELTALQRIVRGEQAMTVYKPITAEAHQAADIAVSLVTGGKVSGSTPFEGVDAFIFKPRAVTVDNLTNTVVRDGQHTTAEICDEQTAARCKKLGIH
jgi:D-xylose transport system substrate-binding protein